MITEKRKLYLVKYRADPKNKARHRIGVKKWASKNPEKVKLYKNKWIKNHGKEWYKEWSKANAEKLSVYRKNYYKTNNSYPKNKSEISKKNWLSRIACLEHYSKGKPNCVCCGETELKFLALDHINGGGTKHRKGKGNINKWIVANNFPPMFQVLCHNCNCAKGYYGSCPHKKNLGSQSDQN